VKRVREKNTWKTTLLLIFFLVTVTAAYAKGPPIKPLDVDYIYAELEIGPNDYRTFGPYVEVGNGPDSLRVRITGFDSGHEDYTVRVEIYQIGKTLYDGVLADGQSTGYKSCNDYETWVRLSYVYGEGYDSHYTVYARVDIIDID